MIELTFATAFMLYLTLTFLSIFGFWIAHHYFSRKKVILSEEKQLRVCEYCQFAYLEDQLHHVNQCPQCGSFNKNNNYK